MLKKIIAFFAFVFLASMGLATHAQNAPDLREIYVRFCNDDAATKTLSLDVASNEDVEVCLTLGNNYEEDLGIGINFVDGTVTNDAAQKPACKNETDQEIFGQYVDRDNEIVSVPANSTVEKTVIVNFPEEYAGEVYGCLTARLASDISAQDADTATIAVINRLGYPMKFFVDGEVISSLVALSQEDMLAELSTTTRVIASHDGLLVTKSDEGYIAYVGLYNDGNVLQQLTGTIVVETMKGTIVSPLEQNAIQPQSSLLVPVVIDLPWYGLNLNVSAAITHEPQLVVADDTFDGGEVSLSVSRFVITLWDWIILGAIALLFLIIALRKKRKK